MSTRFERRTSQPSDFRIIHLTKDQIILLLDLKDSKERGSASMSCGGWRGPVARQLKDLGLVELNKMSGGSTFFYSINEKGLQALKKARRK